MLQPACDNAHINIAGRWTAPEAGPSPRRNYLNSNILPMHLLGMQAGGYSDKHNPNRATGLIEIDIEATTGRQHRKARQPERRRTACRLPLIRDIGNTVNPRDLRSHRQREKLHGIGRNVEARHTLDAESDRKRRSILDGDASGITYREALGPSSGGGCKKRQNGEGHTEKPSGYVHETTPLNE